MSNEPVDVSCKPPAAPAYLGDGCYVEYDGYQLWVYTTDGVSVQSRVALDRTVYFGLTVYAKQLNFMSA